MMRFVDTHAHIYDETLLTDQQEMIDRALSAGVEQIYMPNCDSTTIAGMIAAAERWPEHCFPMMGLHPVYVKSNYQEELGIVRDWLEKEKFYAVGEIGLDKYWDLTYLEQQKEAFAMQIDWALEYGLPIVIHSRESTAECIEIVRQKQDGRLRGIFHCFSGTAEEAREITELGLLLGIGGVLTFKKSTLPQTLEGIGLEHLVLETDAPYLAPVPYRGKRNESSYIPLIAGHLAALKQVAVEEVAAITTGNAEKVFGNRLK